MLMDNVRKLGGDPVSTSLFNEESPVNPILMILSEMKLTGSRSHDTLINHVG